MAVYTYEVDHGDDNPRVCCGMELNGGRVVAVEFGAALSMSICKHCHKKYDPTSINEMTRCLAANHHEPIT
jgi:hypothetical protein